MNIRRVKRKVPVDTDVHTLALERTAYVMDHHDRVAVSFSGGKDSTAVLNTALEVAHADPRHRRHLPLRVVFYDEEAIPQETEDYVRRISQRDDVALEWYCLPVKHRNACSRRHPYWWPWAPETADRWCRPLPPEALTHLDGFPTEPPDTRLSIPDANGLLAPGRASTALLMGIRAQESLTRRRAVSLYSTDNYLITYTGPTGNGNLVKAYPVYDWTTEDVWTAPAQFGWDYNRAYDLMEMAGIAPHSQRCSPAFGEEPIGKLSLFATCFPDVWARMVDRVPGVGAAYRYARTELYGYGKRPTKPDGVTWPDFVSHYLTKFGPDEQSLVANRIRDIIRRHYHKTTDPILPKAPHPDSGVSWDFLASIAMRGDFKQRRRESMTLRGTDAENRTAYLNEHRAAVAARTPPSELGHPRPLTDPPEAAHTERHQ